MSAENNDRVGENNRADDDTNRMVNDYVKGFEAVINGNQYGLISPVANKRPHQAEEAVAGGGEEEKEKDLCPVEGSSGGENKKSRTTPSFIPPELNARGASTGDDTRAGKKTMINAYLDSCYEYLEHSKDATASSSENVNAPDVERGDRLPVQASPDTATPTKTTFWRDGEEISLNDGEDGLSTDFGVRCIFTSIVKTLNSFYGCSNINVKSLKRASNAIRHDVEVLNSKVDVKKRYANVISAARNLILRLDTSKGSKRITINQLEPYTCRVSKSILKEFCRFNGFGTVGRHGYLECRFYIPIKLLFVGNMETKHYQDSEYGDNTVYNIELNVYFGSYFYDSLDTIYDYCFEVLEEEVRRYKKKESLRNAQMEEVKTNLKTGDMSSLMRLNRTTQSIDSDPLLASGFFGGIERLVRRDHIRILGTSGKLNTDSRLSYVGYDSNTRSVVEGDPENDVDALFVSSFIRFRINREGDVYMDVYTRNALRLEA